jgi:predicted enzyme related to lactoylglutathione lyase
MITKANTVGIYVRDQQRALEFYRDKLGFQVIMDAPMTEAEGGPRWLEVAPPGAQTHFVLFTPEGQEDRIGTFSNIVFDCDDIQQTYQELSSRGVEFAEPPSQQPWGWWATFKDPDGNTYGLGQH